MVPNFFSVIVVCLNPGEKLAATVESVLKQRYERYEIIVKDGGSTDGSVERLPQDSRIRLVEKKDSGIYDAMNQALPFVTGAYVLFLNCGDVLYDDGVFTAAAGVIGRRRGQAEQDAASGSADGSGDGKGRPAIFYGNLYNRKQRSAVYSAPVISDFTCYRNVPCHQVCFYAAALFSQRGYDIAYRVRADYEHFLYCIYERKAEAVYMDFPVADYEGGGFSETGENRKISAQEHREITARYLGRKKAFCYRLVMLLSFAGLRTRLAEDERYAAAYNSFKSRVYGLLGKGQR